MSSNDDMLMRKVEQEPKCESFPPAYSNLLRSLNLMSPIGTIRQREPGPVTSTPRVGAAVPSDHIYRLNYFDKLPHIHEVNLTFDK